MKRKNQGLCFQNSKKGNAILDGLTILVVIVVFAFISIFTYYMFNMVNTDIQNDNGISSEGQAVTQTFYNQYADLFDNIILFAFGLLFIGVLISVFFLDTHPVFFIVTLVLLIALFIVGILIANAYDDVMEDSLISSYAEAFTYSTWLLQHLGTIAVVMGFAIMLTMFIKLRGT